MGGGGKRKNRGGGEGPTNSRKRKTVADEPQLEDIIKMQLDSESKRKRREEGGDHLMKTRLRRRVVFTVAGTEESEPQIMGFQEPPIKVEPQVDREKGSHQPELNRDFTDQDLADPDIDVGEVKYVPHPAPPEDNSTHEDEKVDELDSNRINDEVETPGTDSNRGNVTHSTSAPSDSDARVGQVECRNGTSREKNINLNISTVTHGNLLPTETNEQPEGTEDGRVGDDTIGSQHLAGGTTATEPETLSIAPDIEGNVGAPSGEMHADSKNARIPELACKINLFENEDRNIGVECEVLKEELEEARSEIETLQRKLHTKRVDLARQTGRAKLLEEEQRRLVQENSRTVQRLEGELNTKTDLLKNVISEKDALVLRYTDDIRGLRKEIEQLNTENDRLSNSVIPQQASENKRLQEVHRCHPLPEIEYPCPKPLSYHPGKRVNTTNPTWAKHITSTVKSEKDIYGATRFAFTDPCQSTANLQPSIATTSNTKQSNPLRTKIKLKRLISHRSDPVKKRPHRLSDEELRLIRTCTKSRKLSPTKQPAFDKDLVLKLTKCDYLIPPQNAHIPARSFLPERSADSAPTSTKNTPTFAKPASSNDDNPKRITCRLSKITSQLPASKDTQRSSSQHDIDGEETEGSKGLKHPPANQKNSSQTKTSRKHRVKVITRFKGSPSAARHRSWEAVPSSSNVKPTHKRQEVIDRVRKVEQLEAAPKKSGGPGRLKRTPWACDYPKSDGSLCDKIYTDLYNFLRHMEFHVQPRDVPCTFSFCQRLFNNVSDMREHLVTHGKDADKKLIKCRVCKTEFKNGKACLRHMRNKNIGCGGRSYIRLDAVTGRKRYAGHDGETTASSDYEDSTDSADSSN